MRDILSSTEYLNIVRAVGIESRHKLGGVIMWDKSKFLIFLLLVFTVGSCTGIDSPVSTSSDVNLSEILIEYHRSGGILGLDDYLVIDGYGNATVTREGKQYKVVFDAETMDQLQYLFEEAEFTNLERKYFPSREGSDFFKYIITYKNYTVQTMDTAVPDVLWPVLDALNRIIEST